MLRLVGVDEPELGRTYAESLRAGGVERAFVVCGAEKLDEISCAGETHFWELKNGRITEGAIHPHMFGLSAHPLTEVAGGNPEENAETFRLLLTSGAAIPERLTPVLDFVLLNSAALLVVAGIAKDFKEGVKLSRESIVSGKAWEAIELFKQAGRAAAAKVSAN